MEARHHWAPARTTTHSIQLSSSPRALDRFSATLKIFFLQPKCLNTPPHQNHQSWQGGLAKSKNFPTVGSHKPELAVPQQPCAMPKSHLGHQPGNGERVRDPSAALWLFHQSRSDSQTLQPQRSEPLDAHQRGLGRGHSWQEPREGLQELLREVFLQQTDLWA